MTTPDTTPTYVADGCHVRDHSNTICTASYTGKRGEAIARSIADALNAGEAPQASEPAGEWSETPPPHETLAWLRVPGYPDMLAERREGGYGGGWRVMWCPLIDGHKHAIGFCPDALNELAGARWCLAQAPVATQPHCGHPVSAVYSGREGTNHCTECEREGRGRRKLIAAGLLDVNGNPTANGREVAGLLRELNIACEADDAAPAQQPTATDADLDALLALVRGMVATAKKARTGDGGWIPGDRPAWIEPIGDDHELCCNPAAIQRLGELVERVAARCRQVQQPAQEAQEP